MMNNISQETIDNYYSAIPCPNQAWRQCLPDTVYSDSCQEVSLIAAATEFIKHRDLLDRNCCKSAISALNRAAILQPGMASTWRLLGESASLVSALSEAAVTRVRVLSVLLRTEAGPEDSDVCTRAALVELSVRCYTKSLALEHRYPPTWHDLGLAQAASSSLDTASVSPITALD